jgi:hypothetical protein
MRILSSLKDVLKLTFNRHCERFSAPALATAPGLRLGRRGAKGASAAGQGSNLLI